ncbi:signal recognition particle-docking protein FtsY [uncultured Gardnerella sp.]|uniref:signal recognition particle-docking protein FtsY n=1 Tax=uncultured Gardnerella sp. TaxID=293424 RepID=UPI0026222A25|nr:signal recognition particle-docking protein FtsY [uncultured Gardnerella sp.]
MVIFVIYVLYSKNKKNVSNKSVRDSIESQSIPESDLCSSSSESSESEEPSEPEETDSSSETDVAEESNVTSESQVSNESNVTSESQESDESGIAYASDESDEIEEKPKDLPQSLSSRIQRLRARLSNSKNPFGRALFTILSKDHIAESDWEEVEDTLLLADVGAQASEELVESLRKDARITGVSNPDDVRSSLRSRLLELVGEKTDRRLNVDKSDSNHPSVIMMVGVNGTGKTTTAGKLARLFVSENHSVILAAADTFRAAAADQLSTWASAVNVPVVRSYKDGADPASVAFDAAEQASKSNVDVLIVDTAGRLQNKSNLMDELGKIRRVIEKTVHVDEVLLVLDATTGQNGMAQAKVFAEAIGITGVVLTKLDGSAKGGIVISVQKELGVPVKLVGLGEGPDDLAPFEPESFVDGILS